MGVVRPRRKRAFDLACVTVGAPAWVPAVPAGAVPIAGRRALNMPGRLTALHAVGRVVERLGLTELPQLWAVDRDRLSLVGNRPPPVDVVEALRAAHPDADDRFAAPCGLAGPVQLVGRDHLSDGERLALEAAYATAVARRYRVRLDVAVRWRTALVTVAPGRRLTLDEAHGVLDRAARPVK